MDANLCTATSVKEKKTSRAPVDNKTRMDIYHVRKMFFFYIEIHKSKINIVKFRFCDK